MAMMGTGQSYKTFHTHFNLENLIILLKYNGSKKIEELEKWVWQRMLKSGELQSRSAEMFERKVCQKGCDIFTEFSRLK